MTRARFEIPAAIRLTVGVVFILLSIPSFSANAVMRVFRGVDDRAIAVALAALGGWAVYDGVRGLLRARDAKAVRQIPCGSDGRSTRQTLRALPWVR